MRKLIYLVLLVLALPLYAAEVYDGNSPTHIGPDKTNVVIRIRPTGKTDDGKPIAVRDVEMYNIKDQVGIFLDGSYKFSNDLPEANAASITVENIITSGFRRTQQGHLEDVNIRGWFDRDNAGDVVIRNVNIRNSVTQSPPVFINDFHYRLILIDGVRSDRPVTQTTLAIDLKSDPGQSTAACVVILNSPIKVLLQGNTNSFGAVISDGTATIETATVQWRGKPIRPSVKVFTFGVEAKLK